MTSVSRILDEIRNSVDPLHHLRKWKSDIRLLELLNTSPNLGYTLCCIVSKNYGMGVKLLIDSGLDLSAQDSDTGNTPLLVVCSEGLCGPSKRLIKHLPPEKLLHCNHTGCTVLHQLLVRAHGQCGCVSELLVRLPAHLNLLNSTECRPIIRPYPQSHPVSVGSFVKNNIVVDSLASLLQRIRSDDIGRITSVVQVWITGNLLLLPDLAKSYEDEYRETNLQSLQSRIISPPVHRNSTADQHETVSNIMHLLSGLIIVNQLPPAKQSYRKLLQWVYRKRTEGDSTPSLLVKELELALENAHQLPTLRNLVIYKIRHLFQTLFVAACQANCTYNEDEKIHAFIFPKWIEQLYLPTRIKQLILLDPHYVF